MKKKFKEVAEALKRLRQAKGVSQYQLAMKISTKPRPFSQMISNIERGLCSIPEKQILAFADALSVDASLLIEAMCVDHALNLNRNLQKQREVMIERRSPETTTD